VNAKAVMVLGTTSGAGKSWLATALCRWYARLGFKVAPFKAQNMSNNARVVAGGEIGSAQYFQALAAGVPPHVRMNPVLLKPEADTRSQVILLGKVDHRLSSMAWRRRSSQVWPAVKRSLKQLLSSHDIVVIEGAGSPAEINLMASDVVNMRIARHARARCLLVTDIDRGGAFAHLYGTWKLLEKGDQKRVRGFVLNKFRGDAALLAPGPDRLRKLTGIPTVAVLPLWRKHGLPEEDGVYQDPAPGSGSEPGKTIAIVSYPRISNLDEFQPLTNLRGVRLRWIRRPADIKGADWVILPGSKHTSSDLSWVREQGLDLAVHAHASAGKVVLGICGGLQMLGQALKDRHCIDGNAPGLDLLPLVTEFQSKKIVRPRRSRFKPLTGPWAPLSGMSIQGYEIHNGRTSLSFSKASVHAALPGNLAWQNTQGNVLGLYLHGLFEDARIVRSLFGSTLPSLENVFDGLADFIDEHFQPGVLESLIAKKS
jgi:adenosylcobyric acid synthase